MLKSYVGEVAQENQWEQYLPLIEYACNTTVHSSMGKALFELIEGRLKPPLLLQTHDKICATDEYVHDISIAFEKIKEAIKSCSREP